MPATQSPYVTFAKMQQVLKAKRPELKVVTTEAAYIQMLASGVLPSRFVIEMANADGDVVSSQIKEFARGKILNQTAAEKKKKVDWDEGERKVYERDGNSVHEGSGRNIGKRRR